MENNCPICHLPLEGNVPAFCVMFDHSYFIYSKNNIIYFIRIRLGDLRADQLRVNIDYDINNTQITMKTGTIILNKVINLDLSDIDKFKEKIKMYVLFS